MTTRRAFLSVFSVGLAATPLVAGSAVASTTGLRAPNGHLIVVFGDTVAWNCRVTEEWEARATNEAGSWLSPYPLMGPARIDVDGQITIPHKYGEWEMAFQGPPFVYGFFPRNITSQPVEVISEA